jgi:hypothetical protein
MATNVSTTTKTYSAKMNKTIVIILFFLSFSVDAKEIFSFENIFLYFNEENPYFYNSIGKEYIAKEKEYYYKGAFDTQLKAQYDEKSYPLTTGTFQKVEIVKPIENGIEFSVAYRKSIGTQEYNNIKTGEEGEVLTGIKIPIFSVFNNTSKNKIDLVTSKVNTKTIHQNIRSSLNRLSFQIFKTYYQILLNQEIVITEKQLLEKAQSNFVFMSKEVASGKTAKISLYGNERQVINRKQRKINADNLLLRNKNIFLQYLGISKNKFNKKYFLPRLPQKSYKLMSFADAQTIAINNNPQLQEIEYKIEKIKLQQEYNTVSKYPNLNLNLYGAHDFKEKKGYEREGYKISVDFSLPIEQRKYKGQKAALKKEILLLQSSMQKIQIDIQTNIKNILLKAKTTQTMIWLSKKELVLTKKLEDAEKIKYREGLSQLQLVNLREMKTLQVEQKLLKYYYDYKLLKLELKLKLGIDIYLAKNS